MKSSRPPEKVKSTAGDSYQRTSRSRTCIYHLVNGRKDVRSSFHQGSSRTRPRCVSPASAGDIASRAPEDVDGVVQDPLRSDWCGFDNDDLVIDAVGMHLAIETCQDPKGC